MFIYFLEQVWTLGQTDWLKKSWETHETQRRYWEGWHASSHNKVTYPMNHMVEGNDYLEW